MNSKNTSNIKKNIWTAGDLEGLLWARYKEPEFAFLTQVRNGTGFSRQTIRTADAIALSLYPSRGIDLHGFEIKISRSDFRNELKNPAKAEDIAKFCNFWWIVSPGVDITPVDEVPSAWGLLVADKSGKTLKVARQAKHAKTKEIDRLMLASIFRNISQRMIPKTAVKNYRAEIREEISKMEKENYERGTREMARDLADQREMVSKLEKIIGERITKWSVDDFGSSYRMGKILNHKIGEIVRNLGYLSGLAEQVRPVLNELKKIEEMKEKG